MSLYFFITCMFLSCLHVLLILFIVRSQLSEMYGEEAWYKLKQAIKAVQSSQSISYSLEELYKAVKNSCSHGMSATLYENLKTSVIYMLQEFYLTLTSL